MLAYDSFQMNYHNLNPASMQPLASPISLPPISSIDFRVPAAHQSPPDVIQPLPLPPPPPRHLPPLSYYNGGRQIPQEPQYVQQQSFYRNMQAPSQYAFGPGTRVPLPSTTDPSLMVAPARHKTKEVKRRTKTGCLTCRKRRIKVRTIISLLCYFPFHLSCEISPVVSFGGKFTRAGRSSVVQQQRSTPSLALSHARTVPKSTSILTTRKICQQRQSFFTAHSVCFDRAAAVFRHNFWQISSDWAYWLHYRQISCSITTVD